MVIFVPSAVAVLIRLRCPACGALQARARGSKDAVCACRDCKTSFTHADGALAAAGGESGDMSRNSPRRGVAHR
jgi:hypothetical protein